MLASANSVGAATLSVSPTTQSVVVGDTFMVNILLDTQGTAVDGVDIRYLNYNPSLLQVQDVDANKAGTQIAPGTLMSSTLANTVDTTQGRVNLSQIISAGGTKYTGSGVLATITFRAIAAGTANVSFDYTASNTTDSNVAAAGTDTLTGVTNGSYTVRTVIISDTTAPLVSITAPANNATVSGQVPLSAQASDNVGVVGVQFKLDGVNLGAELTTAPYSGTWNTAGVAAGSRVLTAVARDAANNTKVSTPITVVVSNVAPPPANVAPTVNAGNNQTIILPSTATLDGTAIDPDDTSLTYLWSKVSGPTLPMGAFVTTTERTTVTFVSPGTYVFRLTVSDGTDTSSDEVTVTVQAAPVVTTDTDNDGVFDSLDRCPNTPLALRTKVNARGCTLPRITRFSYKTDLMNTDLSSLSVFELGTQYGQVLFNTPLNLLKNNGDTELDIDSHLTIQNRSIALDATSLPELNKPATITFYSVSYNYPRILKNGAVCSDCTLVSYYKGGALVFRVSSFSTYTVEEGPAPTTPPPTTPPQNPPPTTPSQTPQGVFTPTVPQLPPPVFTPIPVAVPAVTPRTTPRTTSPTTPRTPVTRGLVPTTSEEPVETPLTLEEEQAFDNIYTPRESIRGFFQYIFNRIKRGFLRIFGK